MYGEVWVVQYGWNTESKVKEAKTWGSQWGIIKRPHTKDHGLPLEGGHWRIQGDAWMGTGGPAALLALAWGGQVSGARTRLGELLPLNEKMPKCYQSSYWKIPFVFALPWHLCREAIGLQCVCLSLVSVWAILSLLESSKWFLYKNVFALLSPLLSISLSISEKVVLGFLEGLQ